jgi:hypothetical protein
MYPPTTAAMRTQAATAAPAMAFAGTTPLSGGGAELIPIGAAAAATIAREGVGLELVDKVPVEVALAVAVVVEVALPVPVPVVLEGGVGVGASPDPVPVPVGVPVAELDGTIYTVAVAVLLGYAVGLAVFATTEGVWV